MATAEDLNLVIAKFGTNFPEDGFIAFNSEAAISFMGSILINYKGLRLVRFKKSQLMQEQFNDADFSNLCNQTLNEPNKRQELFNALKQQYPQCSICILEGGICQVAGQLSSYQKGNIVVAIF